MKLFVHLPTGKVLEIVIDANKTVDNLKQRIEDKEGIPSDQQRLIFAGQQLDAGKSLESYHVQEGCGLFMVLRLGGPPNPRNVTWRHKIVTENVTAFDTPIANAQFTVTMNSSVNFLTAGGRSNGQNLWRSYWTGPEYNFSDVVVSDWVVVLKLSTEFSSIVTEEELKAHLDAVRYNYCGINGSYYGGQSDSWQRYTSSLPVASTLSVVDKCTFTIDVTEQLEPDTLYAVVFLNNFSRSSAPSFFEDYLLPFKTAASEPATSASAEEIALGDAVFDAFICPIGLGVMVDPVVCADGHSYDRVNIERWLLTSDRSPKTGLPLGSPLLLPNHALLAAIQQYGKV